MLTMLPIAQNYRICLDTLTFVRFLGEKTPVKSTRFITSPTDKRSSSIHTHMRSSLS
jgi:hypothetical protein